MKCPFCSHKEDRVVDSRSTRDDEAVRRRRECLGCGARYTTYEYVERSPVTVVKADGRRVSFDREKILHGLLRACEKRLSALPVLMYRKVHCAPVLESCPSRLTLNQISAAIWFDVAVHFTLPPLGSSRCGSRVSFGGISENIGGARNDGADAGGGADDCRCGAR